MRRVPDHELGARARALREQRDELAPSLGIAVDDGDRRHAGERALDRDRARRAARAEQHERRAGRIDGLTQRGQEALAVGVLADPAIVAAHDAVHGADHLRGLAEAVEVLDHRDLVGDRAVEAGPAHRPRTADGVAEIDGGDVAVHVPRVEAVVAVGGLDHRHGRVLGRRRGERAGEQAQEARRG
jgi:hypothetical protein